VRPPPPGWYGLAEFGSDAFTFTELLDNHPNVIAYVSGHTHEHQLLPCGTPRAGGDRNRFCTHHLWWEINTSAVADWPHEQRLVEVMDNRDGTLSIFGTVLDHASPATAPAAGSASGFVARQLASIGRTLGFNDRRWGRRTARATRSSTRTPSCVASATCLPARPAW
jgi:hypothetical protein